MTWAAVGSAAISGISSIFAGRSARKADEKAAKERLALLTKQNEWAVQDREAMRGYELEDRKGRQELLNPYAKYFKGERLAKPDNVVETPVLVEPDAPIGRRTGSAGAYRNQERQYRTAIR